MANRSLLRWFLLCPLAALLLTTVPIALRRFYPGVLGSTANGRDILDAICFDMAYLRSLVIYFVIVLTPVSLVFAVLSGNSARQRQLSRRWKWAAIATTGLWIGSFFVCLWHSDNTTYLVKLWNGVLSLHSGRCLPCNGCLRWYEEYTDYGNTSYLLVGVYDYHYIWQLPTILKRWLLPNTYTHWSLRIIDLPIWPFIAPIVAWTIVLWSRSRPRSASPSCPSCGYNLTANVSGICPECGKPVPQGESKPAPNG